MYELFPPLPVSAETKIQILDVQGIRQLGVATGAWRIYEDGVEVGVEGLGRRVGVEGVKAKETVRYV